MKKRKKQYKRKRLSKKNQYQSSKMMIEKNMVFGISFGVVFGLVILTGLFLFNKKTNPANNDLTNPLQYPYYQNKDFMLPEDITNIKIQATNNDEINQIKIPIIMYHYVEYITDKNDTTRMKLDINPYYFEKQLETLSKYNYDTYFIRDIPDIFNKKINYSSESAILTFDDGYVDFYTVVYPLLKKYQIKATVYVINNYIGRYGFLNENQIKEMLSSGLVELGAHTLDHLYLKSVSDNVAEKQIIKSKKDLEEKFGVEIKTFAYPYGAFNNRTVEIVKESGYVAAVSVIPGIIQSSDNLFYLNRVRPGLFSDNNIVKVLSSMSK